MISKQTSDLQLKLRQDLGFNITYCELNDFILLCNELMLINKDVNIDPSRHTQKCSYETIRML